MYIFLKDSNMKMSDMRRANISCVNLLTYLTSTLPSIATNNDIIVASQIPTQKWNDRYSSPKLEHTWKLFYVMNNILHRYAMITTSLILFQCFEGIEKYTYIILVPGYSWIPHQEEFERYFSLHFVLFWQDHLVQCNIKSDLQVLKCRDFSRLSSLISIHLGTKSK